MLTLVGVEFCKLHRSLALLLAAAAPACVAVLLMLIAVQDDSVKTWTSYFTAGAAMWAYFMLPMSVTALTILVAQVEHRPNAWNAVLALPIARWRIFAAKATVVVGLVAAMTVALMALIYLGGFVIGKVTRNAMTGEAEFAVAARLLGNMFAGSLLMIAIQLWAALRFSSFVPPLILGIGGAFVAVAATAAKQGVWFPWLIAVQALGTDPQTTVQALWFGFAGGVVALVGMLVHMSRYEAP